MRVLLTGSAGFIGATVADQLEARGDEVVRVDLMLPMAHGSTGAPDGTHHEAQSSTSMSGVRDASVSGTPSSSARLSAIARRRRMRPAMASLVSGGTCS